MATSTPEPTAASAPQATTINTPEPSATVGGASLSVEERFTAISNGDGHTCVLRSDGSPLCWGSIRYGVASGPAGEKFIATSISQFHICALRFDGSPFCWGEDHHGEGAPPAGEKFIDISSGHKHTCALRSDGSPLCWGSNFRGQASPLLAKNSPPPAVALRIPAHSAPTALQHVGAVHIGRLRRLRVRSSLPTAAVTSTLARCTPTAPPYAGVMMSEDKQLRLRVRYSRLSVAATNTLAPFAPTALPSAGAKMTTGRHLPLRMRNSLPSAVAMRVLARCAPTSVGAAPLGNHRPAPRGPSNSAPAKCAGNKWASLDLHNWR